MAKKSMDLTLSADDVLEVARGLTLRLGELDKAFKTCKEMGLMPAAEKVALSVTRVRKIVDTIMQDAEGMDEK